MGKHLKVFSLTAILVCIGFGIYISCGGGGSTSSEPSTEWTILTYGAGNNNLDYQQGGNSYTIQDVQDLETIGSTDKVEIISMVSSLRTGGIAKYYHVEHYPDDLGDNISSTVLADKGTKDMSDPQTLKDFIIYGITNYPAKKYMLIIDDHGGGWRGACEDEQNGSGNLMSMVNMSTAMSQALTQMGEAKFDIVVFHACLMSMVEVAYELKSCANYMVASEFSMPMESVLGANEWLTSLTATPTMGASDLASNVVTAVYNSGNHKQKYVHMAACDLSTMGHLAAKIDNFATQIHTSAGNAWLEVLDAWLNTNTTDYDDPANVDLRQFAIKIKQEPTLQNINLIADACDSLIAALNMTILSTRTNAPALTRGGFTIYMPYLSQIYDQANYSRLDFADVGWANFVEDFIATIEGLISRTLTVTLDPAGGGTVAANPAQETYQQGQAVTLTATPSTNYNWDHWTINGVDAAANPVEITFGGDNLAVTAHFVPTGGQVVTLNGSITWTGHNLSHPILGLIDNGGNFLKYWNLTGGSQTTPFSVTFTTAEAPASYIYAFDDVNNNGYVQETGEPWNCYDSNGDQYCDWIAYTPGQVINNINITVYAGFKEHGEGPQIQEIK